MKHIKLINEWVVGAGGYLSPDYTKKQRLQYSFNELLWLSTHFTNLMENITDDEVDDVFSNITEPIEKLHEIFNKLQG